MQIELEATSPASTAPDAPHWDEIPFPVECARCGQDLRGCEVPQCPTCKLKFTWEEAIPLDHLKCSDCGYLLRGLKETRCPECGKTFSWKGAIEHYRSLTKPLFEYHWRRRPIRSFVFSCRLALRPKKLWKSISIHDSPAVAGLLAFGLAMFVSSMLSLTLLVTVSTAVIKSLYIHWYLPPGQFWRWYSFGTPYGMLLRGGWSWVSTATTPDIYSCFAPWALGLEVMGVALMTILVWMVAGLGSLLLLQQSMAACRVRFGHVLRVYTYSLIPCVFTLLVYCMVAPLADVAQVAGVPMGYDLGFLLGGSSLIMAWLLTTRAIARAYRDYIHMPHTWAVAIMTQIVAIVFTATVMFVVLVGY